MKIVFLSRYQNTSSRGAESFVKELSSRLKKHHEVIIFFGKDADSFKKVILGKFDLVIPINGRWQSFKISLGRLFFPYKVLIGAHAGIGRDDLWNLVIVRPDVFITFTDHMYKWAKSWSLGIKIFKIPHGIDLKKFSPKGKKLSIDLNPQIVLSVGALEWYKYHDRVIRAVSKTSGVSLLIVGKGSLEKNIRELGNKLLKDRFKLLQCDYWQMPEVYRACNLFTLSSWDREAFGLVYLEALASNLPVVAPDDSSRKEIIGQGGVLVDVSNTEIYSKAIEQALSKTWGSSPREQAEKFSWDKIEIQYEKVINELFQK